MMPATIRREITIQAPAAHVWQFVGTEAGLRQWWQMDVTLEAKAGGHCAERGLLNGVPYQLEGIVAVYDPPRQLVLLLAGEQPGAVWPTTMKITMTLDEAAGATTVRVVHQLAAALPAAPPQRHLEPAHPRPLRQPPTILNQWPNRAQREPSIDVTAAPLVDVTVTVADQALIKHYETWWTSRLIGLLHLMQVKGEN